MVCIEGDMEVNGVSLKTRDAAELVPPSAGETLPLSLQAGQAGAHFMLIEMERA